MFYFNQFLHNHSNLILLVFKGIEVNYLYVYGMGLIEAKGTPKKT
jgi:hypothetical protein